MTVDTTLIPYGFRVIIPDEIIGTRIYDSNSGTWTHKLSKYDYPGPAFGISCVHYNKSLFIRVGNECNGELDFLTYDLERDEWDCQALGTPMDWWTYSDIGVWQDRWFVFEVNPCAKNQLWGLDVLECLSNFEKPWALFDSMPGDLCEWMWDSFEDLHIMNKFYGEHVVLYNRWEYEEHEGRAVLYNLDQKTWDKIELPAAKRARSRKDL